MPVTVPEGYAVTRHPSQKIAIFTIKTMDISTRKMNFVQEFLRVADEDLVAKLEDLLHSERRKRLEKYTEPMSEEEFDSMISMSENDIANGRVTSSDDLHDAIKGWK